MSVVPCVFSHLCAEEDIAWREVIILLNEEVARETINAVAGPAKQVAYYFVRKAVQLNEKELAKFIQQMKTAPEKVMEKLNGTGKEMSVKEILKKDEGAKNIDISELGIGDFKPIARRYGMDFAVVKSRYQDPPKYTVFFKAKDADTIEKVMNEYSAKCIKKEKEVGRKKPSLLAAQKKLKAAVASIPRKEVEKRKEEVR